MLQLKSKTKLHRSVDAIIVIVIPIFSWTILFKGKKVEHMIQGQITTPGTTCRSLFDKCVETLH